MIEHLLLHGGGLDSTAVFLDLIAKDIPFSVLHLNYGQKAYKMERSCIVRQCVHYQVELLEKTTEHIREVNPSSLLFGDKDASPILDSRNLVVAIIGSRYGNNLYMGIEKPFNNAQAWPDCSQSFLDNLNNVFRLSYLTRDVKVIAPFLYMDKIEVCRHAYMFDPDFFEFSESCWTPENNGPCGTCKHCVIKKKIKEECA